VARGNPRRLSSNDIEKSIPAFEMVYWADVLYEEPLNVLEKDKEGKCFLNEPYIKASKDFKVESHEFRQKVNDFVTKQLNNILLNEDKSLNYSKLTDAILKKYFKDLEVYYTEECIDSNNKKCKARNLIRDRLVKVIRKYKNHEIMIIAHSMGSIVAFDVLNILLPDVKINTLLTIGSPLGLPIVVSKIVEEEKKETSDDFLVNTPPGVTSNWFNFADLTDYVALDYKLADDFSENQNGVLPVDILVNNNYEKDGKKNPHKSYGYLRTPELAKVISDFIGDHKPNLAQLLKARIRTLFKFSTRNT
jgi:hypothetical protein